MITGSFKVMGDNDAFRDRGKNLYNQGPITVFVGNCPIVFRILVIDGSILNLKAWRISKVQLLMHLCSLLFRSIQAKTKAILLCLFVLGILKTKSSLLIATINYFRFYIYFHSHYQYHYKFDFRQSLTDKLQLYIYSYTKSGI